MKSHPESQSVVSLGSLRCDLDGAASGKPCAFHDLLRAREAVVRRQVQSVGKSGVCETERLVEIDRPLKMADRFDDITAEAVEENAGLEEFFICLDARRRRPDEIAAPAKCQSELRCDGCSDLLLHGEHVGQLPVELLRPEVIAVRNLYELCGDAQPISRLADTSFEHVCDVQLFSDRCELLLHSLERERR